MPNLSALTPVTTAATALSNLILVSPQAVNGYAPQNGPSVNGQPARLSPALLFHYEGEQTATIESDITDHFIEDNTAIADQIALKPEMITTHGFIGELNDIAPKALLPLQFLADKLTVVSAYTPVISETALIAYTQAFQLYQVAANVSNVAVSAWNSLSGSGGENVVGSTGLTGNSKNQSKQQVAFQQFYGYWRNRTLFTIQTPWAVFQNMAIKSLRAIQSAETNVITDFEVTFKMIRTASTTTNPSTVSTLQGRASTAAQSVADQGTQTPQSSTSLSDGLTNMGAA